MCSLALDLPHRPPMLSSDLVSTSRGGEVIDPELELAIAWQRANPPPPLSSVPLEVARSNYVEAARLLDPAPPTGVDLVEMVIPGPVGGIHAHLYVPEGGEESGVLVWAHGGGWVLGNPASHDHASRRLAAASGQRILSVDYRLAPEHPFPEGQEDVTAAVSWAIDNRSELGAPAIGVGGDSAGALLALVAALESPRGLTCLALCYPALGPELMTDSRRTDDGAWGLNVEDMDYFYEMLLPESQDRSDPRVSPLLTSDVSGLPATVLSIARYDVLHDEGFALSALLEGAGVTVDLLEEDALTHGYIRFGGLSGEVRAAIARFSTSVRATMGNATT